MELKEIEGTKHPYAYIEQLQSTSTKVKLIDIDRVSARRIGQAVYYQEQKNDGLC